PRHHPSFPTRRSSDLDGRLSNPDLKWETTKMFNIGLDLSLFENRLNLTTEYFYNNTEDLLLYVTVPSSLGFSSILKNSGSLDNRSEEHTSELQSRENL